MTTERTWEIRDWNCKTQSYDAPRVVTIAQFKAENAAKAKIAKEIYTRNVAALRAVS